MLLNVFIHERFWSKVYKTEDCWVWTGAPWTGGYGQFWLDGKGRLAHRVAWQLTNGEIPNGMCILHRCDNPPCVNPEHLFLGTKAENNADRASKHRSRDQSGAKHNMARLTVEQIKEIKDLRGTLSQRKIAERFGIAQSHVCNIQLGKKWVSC